MRHCTCSILLVTALGFGTAHALSQGEEAPAFEALVTGGRTVSLDALKGQWVVLFFYPKADTPGCTREACSLRDGYADLQATGAILLGVSLDLMAAQEAFKEKHNLPFELISDEDGRIATAYGVLPEGTRKAQRKTFIIGPEGHIDHIFEHVDVDHHDVEVLELLSQLQDDDLLPED